jgi:hypothetical protein
MNRLYFMLCGLSIVVDDDFSYEYGTGEKRSRWLSARSRQAGQIDRESQSEIAGAVL